MSAQTLRWERWPAGTAVPAGRRWVRLGGDLLVVEPGDGSRGASTTSGLALVTQVGNAFVRDHPEAVVVLDHGRHLVVEAGGLAPGPVDTCWRVEPLPLDTVVVDRPPLVARTPDRRTAQVLDALSVEAWERDVRALAAIPTRISSGPGFVTAAAQCSAALTTLGFTVRTEQVQVPGGTSGTVVADRPGTGGPGRQVVLVTAHLDSVNHSGGPAARAPGADDNGSGAAGVLELGRLLSSRPWRQDLRLLLFGGEEQGLFGSRQYVAALPSAERDRIRAVLNLDMIARRNGPVPGVLLEGSPVSTHLVADLAAAAASVTGLEVSTSMSPFASDHVPFLDAGIPAVLAIEGSDSANHDVHTDRDVVEKLDPGLALEILRMCAAALVGWLDPPARPRPAGPVVARSPGTLDVFVLGADSGVHHKAFGATSP